MSDLGDSGPGALEYARTRHGVRVRAARASTLRPGQLRTLTEFRIAQYVRIGFVDTLRLAEVLAAGRPLTASSPRDVHVVATDETGRLLCTAVLRAPSGPAGTEVSATVRMSARDRPLFPVEQAHGRGVFDHLRVLPDLPVARVMELGGFVKAQSAEPFSELTARAPVEVGVALFRVITGPLALPVSAIVGDLEPKVAKLNLEYFGIQLVTVPGTTPRVAGRSYLEPRYTNRDVRPFAWLTGDMVTALPRLEAVEHALDLPGRLGVLALLKLRGTMGTDDWSTLAPDAGPRAVQTRSVRLPMPRTELDARADELQQAPLLKRLSREEVLALARNVEPIEARRGETVIRAGEIDDALYLVRNGEAVAQLTDRTGEPHELGGFGPGDYFGEIAVLLGGRRTADVVATSDLSLWRLSGAHYRRYLECVTDIDREVSRAAARRVYGQLAHRVGGGER